MNDDKKVNTVRAYCLGGTGFNLGAQLENFRDHGIKGTANLNLAYADTADSDLHQNPNIDRSNCFFLPNAAGSGKYQGQHADAIDAHTKAFLQQFKPSDTLNILITSASGGSGPAWANSIASELLENNYNVIVVVVGTTADRRETLNTKNNINSWKNVAANTGRPPILAYFQNSPATPRPKVDAAIVALVGSLCVLFSGMNHGLDPQDLYNVLHFNENRATSYPARLAQLCMFAGEEHIGEIGNVISVATLATAASGHEISQTPEYQVVGRIPPDADRVVIDKAPIHFVVSTGKFEQTLGALQAKLDELDQARAAIVEVPTVNTAKGNKRGLITD